MRVAGDNGGLERCTRSSNAKRMATQITSFNEIPKKKAGTQLWGQGKNGYKGVVFTFASHSSES